MDKYLLYAKKNKIVNAPIDMIQKSFNMKLLHYSIKKIFNIYICPPGLPKSV